MPSFLEVYRELLGRSIDVSAYTDTVFFDDFNRLSLRTGGPTGAGLAAGSGTWVPRFEHDEVAKGHTFPGEAAWMADPTFAWAGGYSPFSVANSCLRIRMERTPAAIAAQVPNGFDWVSGALTTNHTFAWEEGTFAEARIKAATGKGVWSQFWGFGYGAPAHREIDICEYWSGDIPQHYAGSQHTGTYPDLVSAINLMNTGTVLSDGFHDYGVLWADGRVTFTLDRKVQKVVTRQDDLNGASLSLILAVAGGGWRGDPDETTPDQCDMLVDWVRVRSA